MTYLRIGELAKRSGLGIETIRFYERKGLLDEPQRRPSGYRQYDESVVARLQFIRRSKSLGFTLGEIDELLALWFHPNTACHHVREKAARKIGEIDDRIQSLSDMKHSLKKVIAQCEQRDTLDECPLLDGLGAGPAKPARKRRSTKQSSRQRR
jgi:Hg(II)-responsive transcriptional regulator